jgi:cytoskeletal protein RodZ
MEAGESKRFFIIISAALMGLICVGLIGLGGVIYVTRVSQAQEVAQEAPPPATATSLPPSPTVTPTPLPTDTPPPPTETPLPTATSTQVVSRGEAEEAAAALNSTSTETGAGPASQASPIAGGPTAIPTLVLQTPTTVAPPIPTTGEKLSPASGGISLVIVGFGLLCLLILGAARSKLDF